MQRKGFQQGDVLVVNIQKLPSGLTKVQPVNGRYVLVEGEHSGHAHAIEEQRWGDVYRSASTLYLDVKIPVTVRHEEHRPQVIVPGIYEIQRVREIDPFTEEVRAVRD